MYYLQSCRKKANTKSNKQRSTTQCTNTDATDNDIFDYFHVTKIVKN